MNDSTDAALNIITPNVTARVGKIARLPKKVREELNQRLLGEEEENRETGKEGQENQEIGKDEIGKPAGGENLLEWLNGLGEVQAVLTAQFGGRAITVQNLSNWRLGGFQEWCRQRAAWERAAMVFEGAEDFNNMPGRSWAADTLNEMAAAALGECLRDAMAMTAGDEKRRAVLEVVRALGQLQRVNRATERAERERETYVRAVHDDCARRKKERVELHQAELNKQEMRVAALADSHRRGQKRKKGKPTEWEVQMGRAAAWLEQMKEIRGQLMAMPADTFDPAGEEEPTPEDSRAEAEAGDDGEGDI